MLSCHCFLNAKRESLLGLAESLKSIIECTKTHAIFSDILKRGQIFQVNFVNASVKPVLYKLVDLMKDPIEGFYYREQLTLAPDPDYRNDFFAVEKVLKTIIRKKKKFFLVKYLYYPSKFNQYIPEENLKMG